MSGLLAFAQETPKYKEVLLDGKPARLNIETGEITLLNPDLKSNKPIKRKDSIIAVKKEVTDSLVSKTDSDFHVVKGKETLLDIANRYNTTLTELKRANNLETTLIDKGQKLRVRNFNAKNVVKDTAEVADVEATPSEVWSKPSAPEIQEEEGSPIGYIKSTTDFHEVLKGQTLYGLSKLYGLTVKDLINHNGLTSSLIKVGQQLRIANFNVQTIQKSSVWVVEEGDTLYNISKRNGLTVEELKRLNELTGNLILVGQKLQLK